MITVGLPTWNNKDILWLPLEGLCRQETTQEWELIVMECHSFNDAGWDMIESYYPRLKEAGCKRLLYMFSDTRKPLGQKWKEMALRANGERFMLQGADDYSYSRRIEDTAQSMNGVDWYDQQDFWFYDLRVKKLIMFSKAFLKRWDTGANMTVKTKVLRDMPDNNQRRGVDHFILSHTDGTHYTDTDMKYGGVNTNGANLISASRDMYFKAPKPPYIRTDKTIRDLGIPDDITEKLLKFDCLTRREKLKSKMIDVKFTKDYDKFRKGHEMSVASIAYFNLQDYVEVKDYKLPQPFEEEL